MCWLSHWPKWSLNNLGRNLVFSRLRFPPRGIDESMSHFNMVRGLVPSMVRCKGWDILSWWEDWFLPWQTWVLSHSEVTIALVPTWSDISVEFHSLNGGTWSVTRNPQSRTECLFDESRLDVIVVTFRRVKVRCECCPFWLRVRYKGYRRPTRR